MFEKTFDYCAVGLAHVGLDGGFIRVNEKLCQFLGYTKDALTQLSFQELTAPQYLQEDLVQLDRLLKGEIENYAIEKQYVRSDSVLVWGRLTVSLVRDESGHPEYFISVVEDIDDKKRIETELFKVDALFSKIVSAFSDRTFIWVATPTLEKLHYVNDGFANIYGRNEYELYCSPVAFIDHVFEEDRARVVKVFNKRPLQNWDIQYRIVDASGNIKHLHDRGSLIYDSSEQQTLILGTADDITKEKAQQHALMSAVAKLEMLSKTDALTGLANRREILCQLGNEISRMERGQKVSTLVFVDLNNFKAINDEYGHKVGDLALSYFAKTMQSLLRDSDRFGRIGGDEFVVLLYGTDERETEAFFDRVANNAFCLTLDCGKTIPISFSLGWVEWDHGISSVQEWLDLADEAMYSKKRQHNCDEEMEDVG